jgi:ATP-dependent RNA helicase DeaD
MESEFIPPHTHSSVTMPTPPDDLTAGAFDDDETDDTSPVDDAADEPEHAIEEPPQDADEPKTAYADMKLIRPLMDAINAAGYKYATPVQAAVIPRAMRGMDVIGQAQTGTGKTAAFLIPFMNRWRPHKLKGPIALVMCPTRELAVQVANEGVKLAPSTRFRTVPVYGGTGMGRQLDLLSRGCDLVVGTPGRILDHLRRGTMSFDNVKYVVLDEADRMLDIGFRPDIERILRRCPEMRQTLLMSATVPDEIKRLVSRYMREPVHLNMTPKVMTVDKIRQAFITVDDDRKFDLLMRVVEREQPRQCLIFVERKRWADNLHKKMARKMPSVAAIHGDLPQKQREKIMQDFRTGKLRFMIATDVASRGIDVSGISHVINYDLPMDIENYVHRIGRTGRIGRDGVAIAFVTPEQGGHLTEIEMTINKLIDEDRVDGFEAHSPRKPRALPQQQTGDGGPTETMISDEPPPPAKKPVFGKPVKKYSSRL